ncbi:superoxide dismutase family protein [Paracoccus sp. (in: a-proteobacteria)]|uniref:superoxide dismutase family protein n=1 Tax=Paracoccus sp. TaxID=267 RepID=UPI003A880582
MKTPGLCLLMTAFASGLPAVAQDMAAPLTAEIASADGAALGTVTARPTESGMMSVTIALVGAPPGVHAVHIHETGLCEPPDFASAGGHLANGADHGVMSPAGPHPGDMPNLVIPEGGALTVEYFVPNLTTGLMMDEDGAAFIIHAGADDYVSQPSGEAGGRIGCGVFAP